MVDNKVCNIITSTTSARRCYICNAKPLEINDPRLVHSKTWNIDGSSSSVSFLHAWIPCFGYLLHFSYNIPFRKWLANIAETKKMENGKKQFKDKLQLLVNFVTQG